MSHDTRQRPDELGDLPPRLERLGSDRSIGYFEMTPVVPKRASPGAPATLWSVRAVRA